MLLHLVEAALLTTAAQSSEIENEANAKPTDEQDHEEAVFTLEASIQAAIILTIAVIIIILNTLIITSFSHFRGNNVDLLFYFFQLYCNYVYCKYLGWYIKIQMLWKSL